MGNSNNSTKKAVDKGPFSDKEYVHLVELYKNRNFPSIAFMQRVRLYLNDGTMSNFLQVLSGLLRSSCSKTLDTVLHMYSLDEQDIFWTECIELCGNGSTIEAKKCSPKPQSTLTEWKKLIQLSFPLFYQMIHTRVGRLIFKEEWKVSYERPTLQTSSCLVSPLDLMYLSWTCPSLQTEWRQLYTSTKDGLSFNRWCHHILGYNGPTVLLCQDTKGAVFGLYCESEWKESNSFYGGKQAFLFQLNPNIMILQSKVAGNKNIMYLNTKGVSNPRGFGAGGSSPNAVRLFFHEDLDLCTCRSSGPAFETGRVASEKEFEIDVLEMWGCGNANAAAEAQKSYRKETAQLIDRARKVDKAQFATNEFDQEYLLGKTFGHGKDLARVVEDEH